MTPEEFRKYGRQVVDWIADYWERVESLPVRSQVEPGEVRRRLPAHPPEQGEPFEALLADMDRVVLPGVTHWQHPRFFAYYPANASGPAVLGDLLSSGLGVQGMLWATSPACTELEQLTLDWLAELLGLPDQFGSDGAGGGVIQDAASTSVLVALTAALQRASLGSVRAGGAGGRYAVYASAEAHSAIDKAVVIAGLGERALRKVEVHPETQAMNPAHLRHLIEADSAAGVTPVMVLATVGTTSTGAMDPVGAIGEICREHAGRARRAGERGKNGIWLHVDAAYAGVAAVCPELRWVNKGAEYADSYATNPHKWLLTNFDCNAFWVADRRDLVAALSVLPEFLRNKASESGAVVDYRDWQIPLGRRFRALKLWAVIRWYGAEGLRAHIRRHVDLAAEFAALVQSGDRFELVVPHSLSLVCFRLRTTDGTDQDRANLDLMERLNASGDLYLTHTKVGGRVALRMAIGGTHTKRHHVTQAWQYISDAVATSALPVSADTSGLALVDTACVGPGLSVPECAHALVAAGFATLAGVSGNRVSPRRHPGPNHDRERQWCGGRYG